MRTRHDPQLFGVARERWKGAVRGIRNLKGRLFFQRQGPKLISGLKAQQVIPHQCNECIGGTSDHEKTGKGGVDEMQKYVAHTISIRKRKRENLPDPLSTVNRCPFAERLCLGESTPFARKSVTGYAILHAFERVWECAMGVSKKCAKKGGICSREKQGFIFVKKKTPMRHLTRSHTHRLCAPRAYKGCVRGTLTSR